VNHDPSPREVEEACRWLDSRRRQSCESRIQWSGVDREALHVLLVFVASVTSQALRGARIVV
jgi:hypothetical protein